MRRLAMLPLLALLACGKPSPCDDLPGTCLSVRLLSAANLGERLDVVRFAAEGDDGWRGEYDYVAIEGGQLLPLDVPLPLELPEGHRGVKIRASGQWSGRTLVSGSRAVSDLGAGDRRAIAITLASASGPGRCDDGVQNGDETDIDCGGTCAPCGPSCADGMKNGEEGDVDCGGACEPCFGGQGCVAPEGCFSGRCEGGVCAAALSLASLAPDGGPATGGGQVTLRGELFSADMAVHFGAVQGRLISVSTDGRSAIVQVPPGSAGPVDVSLRAGTSQAMRKRAFAYHYAMVQVTGLLPVGLGGKPYFLLSGHYNQGADMYPDIAVVNEFDDDVSVLLGRGDGTFLRAGSQKVGRMPGTYPLMAAAGDFNGDGAPDFATADNRQPTVSVMLCNGDGTCRSSTSYDLPMGMTQPFAPAATAADFNSDGLDDVATMDGTNGGRLVVYFASADRSGLLSPGQIIPGGAMGVAESDVTITSARIDGDSQPDILVASSQRHTVKIFLGNGDGTFRVSGEFPIGGIQTYVLTVADFNQDGRADVLSANRGSDDVSVLLGRGDGTLKAARIEAACLGPYQIRAGDLDGDGRLDLAVPCFREERISGNVLMLLFGDGHGAVARRLEVPVVATAYGVTLNDWNSDGKLDLATVSVAPNNAMTVFLNESR